MNLTNRDAMFDGTLGAAIGIVYTVGNTAWWGDGTLADVVLLEVLAAACIEAVAGILAFVMRQ
ncbi:MAG: hypothetical protein K2Q28_04725 [Hyphomicrobium sp.]|nr:hypothetical protein [Hyphomicrobium sp.]